VISGDGDLALSILELVNSVDQGKAVFQGDGKPFFAYLAYTAPHDPLHAPREYIEKYKGK